MKRLIFPLFVLLPVSINASPFNYDFVDVQVIKPDSDLLDNGYGLEASYDFMSNYSIIGSYQQIDGSNSQINSESQRISIGVGYHTSLNKVTDFTSSLHFVRDENKTIIKPNDNFKIVTNENGAAVQVGLRRVLGKDVDGTFNLGVRVLGDYEDGYGDLGIEYHMSEALSVGASYSFDNETNSGRAKVRYEF